MKKFTIITFTCIFLALLLQVRAQSTTVSKVIEHHGIVSSPNNGEILDFTAFTFALNGDFVTKFFVGGTIQFTHRYFMNGADFHPIEMIKVGGKIIISGLADNQSCLLAINQQGDPLWGRRYQRQVGDICESANGHIILSMIYLGFQHPIYELIEVSNANGNILDASRHELIAMPPSTARVEDLQFHQGYYMAVFNMQGAQFSVVSDANLNLVKLTRHIRQDGLPFEIKELLWSKRDNYYFLGIAQNGKRMMMGRIDNNQNITQSRDATLPSADLRFELSSRASMITETPNRFPFYGCEPTGSCTTYPNVQAVTFAANIVNLNTGNRAAYLRHYTEFFQLNVCRVYDYNQDMGSVSIVEKRLGKINMFIPMNASNTSTRSLFQHVLSEDFLDCNSDFMEVPESLMPVMGVREDFSFREDEIELYEMDPNHFTESPTSSILCNLSKRSEEEMSGPNLEEDISNSWNVFPNPNNGTFNIVGKGLNASHVEVFDLSGKRLQMHKSDAPQGIEISGLSRGMYLLKITTDEHTYTQKIVVQ